MAANPTVFRFPVYQIDFSAVAAGKMIAASKRRIRWRFGYPSQQALAEGRTGTDCRGEEHEVVVVWSVTSGKRQILMDGKEVHYSSTRAGILDYSWSTKGNHIMKVTCHAAPPMTANPGFRQYDLFIDGQSFFTMPKVYEIGVRGAADNRVPGQNDYDSYGPPAARSQNIPRLSTMSYPPRPSEIRPPATRDEEEQDLKRAIDASLQESRRHLDGRRGNQPALPTSQPSQPAPQPIQQDLMSAPVSEDFFAAPAPTYSSAPQGFSDNFSVMSYTSAPNYSYGSPAPGAPLLALPAPYPPAPPAPYAGAPPPTYAGASSFAAAPPPPAIPSAASYPGVPGIGSQSSFGGIPAAATLAYQPTTYSTEPPLVPPAAAPYSPYGAPTNNFSGHPVDDPFAPKPPSRNDIANEILSAYKNVSSPMSTVSAYNYETPTGKPLSLDNAPASAQSAPVLSMNGLAITKEEEPSDPIAAALKKLVNVDHIDQPAEEQIKLTMKKEEDDKAKKEKNKSKGLPPVAQGYVGSQATLSQIQHVKPDKGGPKENIMKPPPQLFSGDVAAAGMLVVHGQGPPPLQPQGFGAGFRYAGGPGYYPPQAGYQQR